MKSSSLRVNIWLYLSAFTLIIIVFLWVFQLLIIRLFYENSIETQIKETSSQVTNLYLSEEYLDKDTLDMISYEENVCIEIIRENKTLYSSNTFNRGCLPSAEYKDEFFNQSENEKMYILSNERLKSNNLVYATKTNDIYLFVNTSLDPLNNTYYILSDLLIIVSIIVIALAILLGYFISIRISKPITKISDKAKLLAKGNYKFNFEGNNIQEINDLAQTLNNAKIELEKTDQLRRDLLANVSHDLKTPLTMIKGYAEVIKDFNHKDKKQMFKDLDVIIEESNRLNNLVEDILEMSKQESNKELLNTEQFDIVDLIKKVVNRFSIYDDYKIECNTPNKLLIKADKMKIEQVLYNLISNAINYTGKDKLVTINVNKASNIRVEIKDSGKGIKETELPYIWNKYYHSDKNHQRTKSGTGLGLFIVKTILENHNFKYGVITKKNLGTTFYFEIKDTKF